MHPIIAKTFGGLSSAYYFRHFIFGLLFPIFGYFAVSEGAYPLRLSLILMLVMNTVLYPYARFVYESVIDFVVGANIFLVDAMVMLAFKVVTMSLCWVFAIFIAPVGLLYLYFRHSKAEKH